jgi:hypothetical protein
MAGGSHTNFNTASFTTGALSGAGALASALGAGFANFRAAQAQRRETWAGWTIKQLRRALDLSEAFRWKTYTELQEAVDTIAERDRTIADLRRQLKTAMANSRVR